jgi:hypothetical protein
MLFVCSPWLIYIYPSEVCLISESNRQLVRSLPQRASALLKDLDGLSHRFRTNHRLALSGHLYDPCSPSAEIVQPASGMDQIECVLNYTDETTDHVCDRLDRLERRKQLLFCCSSGAAIR